QPALTPCFADTVLEWVPAAILWLSLPYALYDYFTAKRPTIAWNTFNLIKFLLVSALAVIGAAHMIYVIVLWAQADESQTAITKAELLAVIISFLTYTLLTVFVHLQRIYGFVNGGAIWFYLLFQIIC